MNITTITRTGCVFKTPRNAYVSVSREEAELLVKKLTMFLNVKEDVFVTKTTSMSNDCLIEMYVKEDI